jgi:hypothetical protein
MSRADLDLKAAAAIAIVALLAATTIDTPVVRALPSVLLVLVLPGYVLSVALLPDKRDVFERCLLAFGLSLCVGVLGGLLIDRMGVGLTSRSWSVGLAVFTLVTCVVARERRLVVAGSALVPPARESRHMPRPGRRTLVTAAMITGSLAAVVGAVLVARLPASSAHINGYTALWIKPLSSAAGTFTVGVRSNERHTTSFRLVASSATSHKILIRRDLTLAPGRQWEGHGRVLIPRDGTEEEVAVALYRRDHPAVAYRHVHALFGGIGP